MRPVESSIEGGRVMVLDRVGERTSAPAPHLRSVEPRPAAMAPGLDREALLTGVVCFVVYAAIGGWLVTQYGTIGDALARVANGYYVLFSRDPHLAAIGFVWTPLQSILVLPLLLFKNVWPPLVEKGAAANLISALFGAIGAFYFSRLLLRLGLTGRVRRVVLVLFAINPIVLFYAANGMTDLMMVVTLIAAVDGLWGYLQDGRIGDLVMSGLWLGIGFLIRYETVFWAAVVALVLILGFARLPVQMSSPRDHRNWIGGFLILWLSPLVCAITVWLFANWTIMGNPVFFANGQYSTVTQTGTGQGYSAAGAFAAKSSLEGALGYAGQHTLLFPPVVIGLLGLLAFGLSGRRGPQVRALLIVGATIGVPLLQVLLVYRAASAGWARFFIAFVPFGFVAIVYIARLLLPVLNRRLVWSTALGLLLLGDLASYRAAAPATPINLGFLMGDSSGPLSEAGRWVDGVLPQNSFYFEGFNGYDDGHTVIDYLNAHPSMTVLVDSLHGFPIIVGAQHPEQLVITSDRDFTAILGSPFGRVDAILVPDETDDAVNRRYPELRAGQAPWAQQMLQFSGSEDWRLYFVPATAGAPSP
jgi:Dolichyl-phosphate-mannose-protein mannosyltransferase